MLLWNQPLVCPRRTANTRRGIIINYDKATTYGSTIPEPRTDTLSSFWPITGRWLRQEGLVDPSGTWHDKSAKAVSPVAFLKDQGEIRIGSRQSNFALLTLSHHNTRCAILDGNHRYATA